MAIVFCFIIATGYVAVINKTLSDRTTPLRYARLALGWTIFIVTIIPGTLVRALTGSGSEVAEGLAAWIVSMMIFGIVSYLIGYLIGVVFGGKDNSASSQTRLGIPDPVAPEIPARPPQLIIKESSFRKVTPAQSEHRTPSTTPPSPSQSPHDDARKVDSTTSRLDQIAALLRTGVITQAEHDAKRQKIIDEI